MIADPGRVLGRYHLIAEIARGGMGVVYLAQVRGPGGFHKLVVIKELKPDLVEEPAFLTMFLDEARLAARLSHPNIVQTNEVGDDGGRYFMAMDYLDGRGLDHVRRRSRHAGFGLTLHMHLRVICDVLAGLDYAHKLTDFDGSPLDIVHRDVSPQNVFLTFDGQVKLLDFGIAKTADSMHETNTGVVKGKASYMAPEQARGEKVDARADVFSVGILLWEALTGRRLRNAGSEQEKLAALLNDRIPRASQVRPVPRELDEICARAMAWDPGARYRSAGAMQHDLEQYLADAGSLVSARDVGLCISELFREDRATTNAVIEAHVARARGALRDQLPMPVIDVARGGSSPGQPTPSGASDATPAMARPPWVGCAASGVRAPVRRRYAGWAAIGLAAAAVGGAAVVVLTRPDAHAPIAAPATAAVAAAPAAIAAPANIAIEVRVSPDDATISIDGHDVEGNPFVGAYASDHAIHHIRASAPGFVTKLRAVTFTSNITLDLGLERAELAAPTPPAEPLVAPPRPTHAGAIRPRLAPASAPAAPAVRGSDSEPGEAKRPADLTNPYGGA